MKNLRLLWQRTELNSIKYLRRHNLNLQTTITTDHVSIIMFEVARNGQIFKYEYII